MAKTRPHPSEASVLLIEDVIMIKQVNSAASVEFDAGAVADYMDQLVQEDKSFEDYLRVWVHTHPSDSTTPSSMDETTFHETFGTFPWAAMLIMGKNGSWYGRTRTKLPISGGPSLIQETPVKYLWTDPDKWEAMDPAAWDTEYEACVGEEDLSQYPVMEYGGSSGSSSPDSDYSSRTWGSAPRGNQSLGVRSWNKDLGCSVINPTRDKDGDVAVPYDFFIDSQEWHIRPYSSSNTYVVDPDAMLSIFASKFESSSTLR